MAANWRGDLLRYKRFFLNIRAVYVQRRDFQMFMEILLSLVTIGFFAVLAIRPTLLTIAGLLTEIKEKEKIALELSTKANNLNLAQEVYSKERENISLLNDAVPLNANPEIIVRQIEGIAQKNSITISNTSLGGVRIKGDEKVNRGEEEVIIPNSETFSVSFSVSGNYQNLVFFLGDIENMLRPLLIERVTFNTVIDASGPKIVLVIGGAGVYSK